MNPKTLHTLEFPKILEQLAGYTAFAASHELALALRPTTDQAEAQRGQRATSEARRLMDLKPNVSIGGARDVRDLVRRANIGAALEPLEFLDILATLQSARALRQVIVKLGDQLPTLAETAQTIQDCPVLEREITRCITERGEVADDASPALKRLRSELSVAHNRLLDRLNDMLVSQGLQHLLQEPLITLRDDRYVLPIRAEFKGQFRGIVHDQSLSGATLFMEPLATVELQNRWRELQLEEQREVVRILRELAKRVADNGTTILANVSALAELDLAIAKARYANAMRGVEPQLVSSKFQVPSSTLGNVKLETWNLELVNARHPLLDTATVVPISLHLGRDFVILVITGPNTGGKTVTLKTVGLLSLMAQAGLHIPAHEGSRVPVFQGIYADIGDEQSIEQSLSTFSSHLTNIVEIFKLADSRSLVLLDELGAGTDPVEGSALARSILSRLLARRAMTLVATHYAELKAYAYTTPGVENASVEFNVETLSPTYRLSIGLPGRSNALAIASRLGLDPGIIEDARALLSPTQVRVETLLQEIQRDREEAAAHLAAVQAAREDAEKIQRRLNSELRQLEESRQELRTQARAEAEAELADVRQRLRQLLAELEATIRREQAAVVREQATATLEEVKQLQQEVAALPPLARPPELVPVAPGELRLGSTVWVKSFGQAGEVVALPDERGQVEVQIGAFRTTVPADDLEVRGGKPQAPVREAMEARPARLEAAPLVDLQLDLRGLRAEEVTPVLDKYLNDAYLAGMPFVRIVHGKGTGVLRQVVREIVAKHPLVKTFHTAEQHEGGEGATVVVLAV
jgi:DNA mismatch repair protein MutS2